MMYAYGLLLVMALQWLVGSMYIKMTYLVEITPEMNATEQRIADVVIDEFGFDAVVNEVDDADMQFINALGYAAPFIHTFEVNGSVNSFTLESNESKYQKLEVAVNTNGDMRHDQKNSICVDRLFSQFCIGEDQLLLTASPFMFTGHDFPVNSLYDIFSLSSPTPPPEFI